MESKSSSNNMYTPIENRFCSVCAKPLNTFDIQEELIIQRRLGYGSCYDEEEHKIEFCCECFDKLIDSCKLTTLVKDWGDGGID